MPKQESESKVPSVNNHRRLKRITFWGVITGIPTLAAIYAGAAALGYDLPRPASLGELQVVDGKLDDERQARLIDAIEYVDGRISRQESLKEEYRLRREPVPVSVRDELKRLQRKRDRYEKQLDQVMKLNP